MNNIIEFNGIKILNGINTHPGSGNIHQHKEEIDIFDNIVNSVNSVNPVMIEVGCYWAVWSLMFRKKHSTGKNIIIELGKRQLEVGKYNFKLNNFDCSSYHGGFFINQSGTFMNRKNDLEYNTDENIELSKFIPSVMEVENVVGNNLDFKEIYKNESLDIIDILHMDIQGSELEFIKSINDFIESKKILNLIIATHSESIHSDILDLLHGYSIIINKPFGSIGGDGFIHAKIK